MKWTERDWERLGTALRIARQHAGQSQEDVAQQAGVSMGSVQAAEQGRPPRARMPYTVPAIARALGWPAGGVEAVLNGAASAPSGSSGTAIPGQSGNREPLTPEVAALAQRIQRLSPVQRSALTLFLDAFQEGA